MQEFHTFYKKKVKNLLLIVYLYNISTFLTKLGWIFVLFIIMIDEFNNNVVGFFTTLTEGNLSQSYTYILSMRKQVTSTSTYCNGCSTMIPTKAMKVYT